MTLLLYALVLLLVLAMGAWTFGGHKARFYLMLTLYGLAIIVESFLLMFLMIPTYIKKDGAQYALWLFRYFSAWVGLKIELRNHKIVDDYPTPAVVICNHQSSIDLAVLAYGFPRRCVIMMKKSLAYIPFFNIAAWLGCAIFVDRTNAQAAKQSLQRCADLLMQYNHKVFFFPEGTRHHEHGLLPFKLGAFNVAVQAQIPIIPMVVSSYESWYSKPEKRWDLGGDVIVETLEPIPTVGLTKDDVPRLAEETREKMLVVYERLSKEVSARTSTKKKSD